MRCIKKPTPLVLSVVSLLASQAAAQSLFDFDSTPYHTPLPIDLTVGDITASFSGTGPGYSIQRANQIGFTPVGFAGNCLYPNSVSPSDLLVSFFPAIQNISIMYAPSEQGCGSSATMRITGFMNSAFVATSTATAPNPGTWPTGVLTLSFPQGFDSVVIHYDAGPAPPACNSAAIFLADNMTVTPVPIPVALNTLTPCRLLDTRKTSGPDAAFPALAAQTERQFALWDLCGIPPTAKALSVNVTAVAATLAGNLVIYPGNESPPSASLLNFPPTAARANNAIVKLAPDGTVKVLNRAASGTVEFVLDVNGYFQ